MKPLRHAFNQLFADRKIVIVSNHRVRSLSISQRTQVVIVIALLLTCSWSSYSTGIFLAYQNLMQGKEAQIQRIAARNDALSLKFALMHNDMQRMVQTGVIPDKKEGYDSFITDLYAAAHEGEGSTDLVKRIGFLETRVVELESYQQNFLHVIGSKTALEIDKIKRVMDMTGVNLEELSQYGTKAAKPAKAVNVPEEEEVDEFSNQGGPFIGVGGVQPRYFEKDVMDGISELAVLHGVYLALPIGLPIKDAKITSHFGGRRDPLTRRAAVHYGLDLSASAGANVFSTAPGTVTNAGRLGAYGNLVEIDHGYGITTRYGHLRDIHVQVGDIVKQGDTIGVQGNTGRSTGTHLHYEVRLNDRPVDPQKFLNAGNYVEEKRLSQAR